MCRCPRKISRKKVVGTVYIRGSIENNSAVDTDLGSEQFKADYTLVGSEPEGVLNFTIDALDYMGNPGSYNLATDGSQVTFDKTPPELTYVNISSNNRTDLARLETSTLVSRDQPA